MRIINRIYRLDDEAARALYRQSGVSHGSVRPQLCVYFLFSIIVLLVQIKVIYTIECVITDDHHQGQPSKRRQQLASASRRALTATRSLVDRTTTSSDCRSLLSCQ